LRELFIAAADIMTGAPPFFKASYRNAHASALDHWFFKFK